MKTNNISVIGLGKLGLPLAACFASKGFRVMGVDSDPSKVKSVTDGDPIMFEPALAKLLHVAGRRLTAMQDPMTAVLDSDVTFVVVPTPSEPGGDFSLKYVLAACEDIGRALRQKEGFHLVVLTSTVMPGSTDGPVRSVLQEVSGKSCGKEFGLCYNPEFVALGSVIHDFLNPDLLLIGESDPQSGEMLDKVYRHVCENSPAVARVSFINAELAKLAVNTFVTTKITFANMLAHICERLPGSQVDVVTSVLGKDSRIGNRYLRGAIGYGGPCFPRDNLALISLGRQFGVSMELAKATDKANRAEVNRLVDLVMNKLPPGGVAGILGLAYKPNTDVAEESQGVLLAQALNERGVATVVYDPAALENASRVLHDRSKPATSAAECVRDSDVVVITTPWDEFKNIPGEALARHSTPRVLVDCWRILDRGNYEHLVEYVPLGESNGYHEMVSKGGNGNRR